MIGIHVVSTTPTRFKHNFLNLTRIEIITMMLSCLYWRKYYGYIKLYTDVKFYDYLKSMNLTWLWDDIDLHSLSNINPKIDLDKFWSYPKMFINSLQTAPFCNLDLDLYLSKKISHNKSDIVVSHLEKCNDKIYPDYHKVGEFDMFDFDIGNTAVNTSIVFVNNIDIYPLLIEKTNPFIIKNPKLLDETQKDTLLLFVEQRVLHSLLINNGFSFSTIIDEEYDVNICDFVKTDKYVDWDGIRHPTGINHLWHWKYVFLENQPLRKLQESLLKRELLINFDVSI